MSEGPPTYDLGPIPPDLLRCQDCRHFAIRQQRVSFVTGRCGIHTLGLRYGMDLPCKQFVRREVSP